MLYILTAIAFVIGVGLVLGSYFGVTKVPGLMLQRKLDARLQEISMPDASEESDGGGEGLLKTAQIGMLPAFDKMMAGTARGSAMSHWLEQTGVKTSVSTVLLHRDRDAAACSASSASGWSSCRSRSCSSAAWASRCRSSSST